MTFTDKVREAKEAAEKASKDDWTYHDNHGVYYVSNGKDGKFAKFDNRICEAAMNFDLGPNDKRSNIKHIATMCPKFTLEMIERYEALEKKLEKAKRFIDGQIEAHRYNGAEEFRRFLKELEK